MRARIAWKHKEKIMNEAYSTPRNIKRTARKHGVSPSQIRRWRRTSEALDCIEPLNAAARRRRGRMCRMRSSVSDLILEELRAFIIDLRERGRQVTVRQLREKFVELVPTSGLLTPAVESKLRRSVLRRLQLHTHRWLWKEGISCRRTTHVAQRSQQCEAIKEGFILRVRTQMMAEGIPPERVVNIDEVRFSIIPTVRPRSTFPSIRPPTGPWPQQEAERLRSSAVDRLRDAPFY